MSASGAANSRPLITCELGKALTMAQAQGTAQSWRDLTDRLKAAKWQRGRSDLLADYEPGQGTVVLANRDRALDPNNGSSPYASVGLNDVGTVLRLHALWPFRGYNDNWAGALDSLPWTVVSGAPTLATQAAGPWTVGSADAGTWTNAGNVGAVNARPARVRWMSTDGGATFRSTKITAAAAGALVIAYKPSACLIPVRPGETLVVAIPWGSTGTNPTSAQPIGIQFQYLNAALAAVGAPVAATAQWQHAADTSYVQGTPQWGGPNASVAGGHPEWAEGIISASLAVPTSPPVGAVYVQVQFTATATAAGNGLVLSAMHADYGQGPAVDEDLALGFVDEWPQTIAGVNDERVAVPIYDWLDYLGQQDLKTREYARVVDPGPSAGNNRPVLFWQFADIGSGAQVGVTRTTDSSPALWGRPAAAHPLIAGALSGQSQGPSSGSCAAFDPIGGTTHDGTNWWQVAPDSLFWTLGTRGTRTRSGFHAYSPPGLPWSGASVIADYAFSIAIPFQTSAAVTGADVWTLYGDDTVRVCLVLGKLRVYVLDDDSSQGYSVYDYPVTLDDQKLHLVVVDLADQSQVTTSIGPPGTLPPVYVDGSSTPLAGTVTHVVQDVSNQDGSPPTVGNTPVTANRAVAQGFHGTIDSVAVWLTPNAGTSGSGFTARPSSTALWAALTAPRDGETASSRLATLLSIAGITGSTDQALDSGGEPLQPAKWTGTALEIARKIVAADFGSFYCDRLGRVRYVSRQNRLRAPLTTPVATIGDRPNPAGGELPASDWTPTYARQDVINEAAVTRQGASAPQVAIDATSQAKYGRRAVSATDVLVRLDTRALDYAQFVVQRLGKPRTRVRQLVIRQELDNRYTAILSRLEPEQRLTLKRRSPNAGVALQTLQVAVQSLAAEIAEDKGITWTLTLADADTTSNYLVLDDAVFGRLDANRLAY